MKKFNNKILVSVFAMLLQIGLMACSKDSSTEDPDPIDPVIKTLTASTTDIQFQNQENSFDVTITTNLDAWVISSSGTSWITLSETSGTSGSSVVKITAQENTSMSVRSSVVTVNANNVTPVKITVTQAGTSTSNGIYPDYNINPIPADATGMSSTTVELAAKINLGWNIGNTFEAPGGETGWGNPIVTEDYIKFVKQQGFNAIRIPSAWDWYHVEDPATARIDPNWLNRVKEVVGYCVNNDIYVLLNIHWDNGWLENHVDEASKDAVNAKQKAFWEQIATTMRDFDEHLMFASANEPNVEDETQMAVLLSYHQTFVDAVRSTGGKNANRTLVMQGPSTNTETTYNIMNTLPTDTVPNRFMVEVHNYTPFQFTALGEDASWGKMFYYWGNGYHSAIEPERNATWGEESYIEAEFQKMKTKFVDNGIPVILGEYGAYRRGGSSNVPLDLEKHNDAIDYWLTYNTQKAIENGIIPFFWDTGGALDRSNNTVKDQRTIDALLEGLN